LRNLQVEPVVSHFQARYSNNWWQLDLSSADLKDLPTWPDWIEPQKGRPQLMLYRVVDDRRGVAYQEYHAAYGEDVEASSRFLFRAISPEEIGDFPFQGIPLMINMDSGSAQFARINKVFSSTVEGKDVMEAIRGLLHSS
jgi:hypothetical protein